MSSSTSKYVATSFMWGGIAKVLDAAIKFASVPLLLTYFGKNDFALVSLALSINAYLSLLDLGVTTGAIKYFSEWIAAKDYKRIDAVARTSITFYGGIGAINALVLILLAYFGIHLFSITDAQGVVMKNLLIILAMFAIINWSTFVFNQLLTANENIAYVQQINIVRSFLGLLLIFITIHFSWSLTLYFTWFTLINTLVVFPYYFKSKREKLIESFIPSWDWANFKIIFKYSMAIIAIGIFSVSATRLRPVVLGIYSPDGIGIVTDYRIMETITLFIINIGGLFMSIFLPKTSKILLTNDKEKIARFAYDGTLYTSIICVILCMPFILSSREILHVYVGAKYESLSTWLIIWVITILMYLHNSPVASLVLSTGKTRKLIYSSAIACTISVVVNIALCKQIGVGSAVIGYLVYIVVQMMYYYFYFNQKILFLNSFSVFKSFIIPAGLGVISIGFVMLMHISFHNLFVQIMIKTVIWFLIFIASLLLTNVISIAEFRKLIPGKAKLNS